MYSRLKIRFLVTIVQNRNNHLEAFLVYNLYSVPQLLQKIILIRCVHVLEITYFNVFAISIFSMSEL